MVEHCQKNWATDKEYVRTTFSRNPKQIAKEIGAELDEDEIHFLTFREGEDRTVLEERLKEYMEQLHAILKYHMMKSAR